MKNILMIGSALMAGLAGFTLLPAQEAVTLAQVSTVQTKDAVGRVVAEGSARNKAVVGSPFSAAAMTESIQTMADGNRIVNRNQQKLYRDGQGRERREVGLQSVSVVGERVAVANVAISDPVAGVSFTLSPEAHTAMKRPTANPLTGQGQFRATVLSPIEAGASVREENLPGMTIEGVYAEGTRTTKTIPAGKVGNERDIVVTDEVWYSPDLQMNVLTKHSDPRGGETTMRLTNIDRSEPDASLFQVPSGYTITEPRAAVFSVDGTLAPPPPPPPPPPAK